MPKLTFELAKLLNTIGQKELGTKLWNRAEKKIKQEKFHTSNIESIFVASQGFLSNRLVPKREIIEGLAEESIYSRSMQFFDVFGFTILRNFLAYDDVKNINEILNVMRSEKFSNQTVFTSPVENSQRIQELIIYGSLFEVASKIIGPFWYYGSDAAVETGPFSLHRDTFFNPPLYKIFIPTQPATFQVLCGTHHTSDNFATSAGRHVCDWDNANSMPHASSSIYYESFGKGRKVVGYDDSHKNPPLTNIPLNPGDVFIFNQNLIHGLLPSSLTTSFIAITAFPSPENSKKFKMNRQEHLENIIKSTVSVTLVDKDLSASRRINSSDVVLPGKAFLEQDLEKLFDEPRLKDYFGLAKIPLDKWEIEIKNNSHASWEILRDFL